eukprot:6463613-Amphidinium_carterae.1
MSEQNGPSYMIALPTKSLHSPIWGRDGPSRNGQSALRKAWKRRVRQIRRPLMSCSGITDTYLQLHPAHLRVDSISQLLVSFFFRHSTAEDDVSFYLFGILQLKASWNELYAVHTPKELISSVSSRDDRVEAAHTLLETRLRSLQEQLNSSRDEHEALQSQPPKALDHQRVMPK